MSEPVYLRKSFPVALIAAVQLIVPAVVVVASLYLLTAIHDVVFNEFFGVLAIISGALAMALMRIQPNGSRLLTDQHRTLTLAFRVLVGWGTVLVILLAAGYVSGFSHEYSRRVVISWALVVPLVVIGSALVLDAVMRRFVLHRDNVRTAVIAGVNPVSRSLADKLLHHDELCIRMEGFFDDRSSDRLGPVDDPPLLGSLAEMPDFVRNRNVDVIFVALPIRQVKRVVDLIDDLRDSTASLYYLPDVFVFDLIQSRTGDIMGMPVVAMCETPFHGFRGVMKRASDVLFTLGILLPALPVMLALAALIRLTSRGPVIFRQRRYGLDGQEITVYKFRSMYVTEDGGEIIQARSDDPRVTPVGRILRKYSLDELPQLINVLQGRMSLVGPRPHAVAHNEEYRRLIKGYMVRHKVLPGITGLAQVNGCRGETKTLEEMQARVNYDLDYLRNWSPLLDFKILLMTVARVFRDRNAY